MKKPLPLAFRVIVAAALLAVISSCPQIRIAPEPKTYPVDIRVEEGILPIGMVGDAYSVRLRASGAEHARARWSLASGALPVGLDLTSEGRLLGVPIKAGNWSFSLRAEDGVNRPGTGAFTLNVRSPGAAEVPRLDVLGKRILDAPPPMEYSLNGGLDWEPSASAMQAVPELKAGDRVLVRGGGADEELYKLGKVEALEGRPDLVPGPRLNVVSWNEELKMWMDVRHGLPGAPLSLESSYLNAGEAGGGQAFVARFYLSDDRFIDGWDLLLAEQTCVAGALGPNAIDRFVFRIPAGVLPGRRFIGLILDPVSPEAPAGSVPELNEGNNATPPARVLPFDIGDPEVGEGAFKVVNSYGTGTGWQNVGGDGHYWITYASLAALRAPVFYVANSRSPAYEPTVLAVFSLSHPRRSDCRVEVGLGDPDAPVALKEFTAREGDVPVSGAQPFPPNAMVLDVSEFAGRIGAHDLFLRIENSGPSAGFVSALSVEFRKPGAAEAFLVVSGETGTVPAGTEASSATAVFKVPTSGKLLPAQQADIRPVPRALGAEAPFRAERPGPGELALDMARLGVDGDRDPRSAADADGRRGGFLPPTADQWRRMLKLRPAVPPAEGEARTAWRDASVDHAKTKYFPPIADQGSDLSCVAFATAYYAHTFAMASEYGWDLSGISWGGAGAGAPQGGLDKIMGPAFVYNMINRGGSNPTHYATAAAVVSRVGCATWAAMPYASQDFASWPSEAAFREAARYRAASVGENVNDSTDCGYFFVEGPAEINLLKDLVASGSCVVFAAAGVGGKAEDACLYSYLDDRDVVSATSFAEGVYATNHAQTIVGFKDGSAWDPAAPDK